MTLHPGSLIVLRGRSPIATAWRITYVHSPTIGVVSEQGQHSSIDRTTLEHYLTEGHVRVVQIGEQP